MSDPVLEVLDAMPCGFFSFTDEGTIIAANETLLRLLGCGPGELKGKRVESILSPGSAVFYQTHFFPLLKLQSRVEELYLSLQSGSHEIPVLAYASRRASEGQNVNDCIVVRIGNRDRYENEILARHKTAETALATEQETARERERLVGILGHDLRVPLTAVTLGAEELVRSGELSGERQGTALTILSSARRAARMVADLLDFTQARFTDGIAIRRRQVDLLDVSRKVIAEIGAGDRSRRVDLVARGNCVGVWDADRIAQVVANLVRNAIEHGTDEAPIVVEVTGLDESVMMKVENPSDATEEELRDIFSPFRQGAARKGSGLGLGLFIVQQIVEAHGGTVSARAANGRFTITTVWPRNAS